MRRIHYNLMITLLLVCSFAYSPAPAVAQGSWATVAPMPTAREKFGAATGPDGRIYAIGGIFNTANNRRDAVESYDSASNIWTSGLAPMPTSRFDMAVVTG